MEIGRCQRCAYTLDYHPGLRGRNADLTGILLVLHKPDSRISNPSLEGFDRYESALLHTDTGKNISRLLKNCELKWDDVYLTNIFKCVLIGDKEPSPEQYDSCLNNKFHFQLEEFKPRKMIVFGKGPAQVLFPEEIEKYGYGSLEKQVRGYQNVPCLVLPHASRLEPQRVSHKGLDKIYQLVRDFLNNNS